jgi:dTDP-4-dehydrorhamnose reductase
MRVVVTGGSGQLAQAISRFWTGHEVILPPESELDLSRPEAIREVLSRLEPQVLINAGAFTQVDRCEAEPELAMRINGEAVGWIAQACARLGTVLVQISTDYVFDGRATRPYREDDATGPLSVYGESKLRGEAEARRIADHLIVRTAWLYDAWGANFYNTMLRLETEGKPLKVVDDQRGAPTTCRALARQLQAAVELGVRGTLHGTCSGETTWHGFAAEIFRLHGLQPGLSPCSTAEFPRPARRPAYSVLSGEKRAMLGCDRMPGWRAALEEVVSEMGMGQ